MRSQEIPNAVISRLPRYYRYVNELLGEGYERISSQDLADMMDTTASQVRQDLNRFGNFGQQGYGYNVKSLNDAIRKILGLNSRHNVIIIGAGNLGQALANYANFTSYGFFMKGMFDINPRLVGLSIRGIEIQPIDNLEAFILKNHIQIAALTIPKKNVKEIVRGWLTAESVQSGTLRMLI